MEICELKLKSKYNSNNFIATTSDGEFLLHSDVIVKMGISKGEYSDEVFSTAVMESAYLIAMEVASTYLANSIKTEKQVKDYLYKKGFKTKTISAVVSKLKEYRILDDSLFVELYIRSNPNFSRAKLKQKLMQFGVKAKDMEDLLKDVEDYESCFVSANKFLKNKETDLKNKIKLTRRLQSQGFSWEEINRVLREFTWHEVEEN